MTSDETNQPATHEMVLATPLSNSKATSTQTMDKNPIKPTRVAEDPWTQNYIEAVNAGICWI